MRGGILPTEHLNEKSQRNLRFIIGDVLRSMMSMESIGALRNMALQTDDGFRTPQYVRDWILF